MPAKPFETISTPDGDVMNISLRGRDVLSNPFTNFGTCYSPEERKALGIEGLLPPRISPLELQLKRVYAQYSQQTSDMAKFVYLNGLHDRNETLYFATITQHIDEMLPIIYTPTVGRAIQEYSHWFNRPRGVYLSIDRPDEIESALLAYGKDADEVDLIVATDSEGILGIGDQGVGGIMIAVGKLGVYIAGAGIHPRRCIPVVLDTGTDNLGLLTDEAYLGERHARVRGERYDAFIEKFVEVATRLFPQAMLHWEDFGASNAHRILERYRGEICTFNDDIQGTAAIVVAAILSGVKQAGGRLSEQRIVVSGAGTAGVGIADLLVDLMVKEGMTPEDARRQFWCLGSRGLIREGIKMRDFQERYSRPADELHGWTLDEQGRYDLADVVRNVHPTILIGTSAQPGSFTEEIVRDMAGHCRRPIILPLSNPTSLTEALPEDLIRWSDGSALIATGSPFEPVLYGDQSYEIAQANNALVFPGLGLGVAVCQATRVTDGMIAAAADAVAEATPLGGVGSSLLPSMHKMRAVSTAVALAVIDAATREGVASSELENPLQAVCDYMWQPRYPKINAV